MPDRRKTRYFEMFGNDVWELCNVDKDFSQADNLAASNPQKLAQLQALFLREAERNHYTPGSTNLEARP